MKPGIFLFFFTALLFQGCLYNYPTTVSTAENTHKKLPQEISEDSIQNYTKRAYYKTGTYFPIIFGNLIANKPAEIVVLDSLLEQKRKINFEKKNFGKNYQTELEKTESAIEIQKKIIHDNKIYHTFSIDHIYKIIKKDSSIQLYETEYLLYPNYAIKDIHVTLSMELSREEDELFYYFIMKYPLYDLPDIYKSNELNANTYDQFHKVIENNPGEKEEILRSILAISKYIRQHNEINSKEIIEIIAKKWLIDHLTISGYKPLKFSNLKELKDENGITIGYRISHLFEMKDRQENITENAIYFEFDMNYVLKGAIEITPPFESYFTK